MDEVHGTAAGEATTVRLMSDILSLLQSVARLPLASRRQKTVIFVTQTHEGPSSAVETRGAARCMREAAGLWGLARTARGEISGATILCIDTDGALRGSSSADPEARADLVASQIMGELGVHIRDFEVVYRAGVRATPSLDLESVLPTRGENPTVDMVDTKVRDDARVAFYTLAAATCQTAAIVS